MRVGFLLNQIDNRGTGNATFDYAHYNEVLLGNTSEIYTFPEGSHDEISVDRYLARFGAIKNGHTIKSGLNVLYHVKSGERDGYIPPSVTRYVVHAVFNGTQRHGDKYAA